MTTQLDINGAINIANREGRAEGKAEVAEALRMLGVTEELLATALKIANKESV